MSNLQKLRVLKMSMDAIPPGGGIQAGIDFLTSPERIKAGWLKAEAYVREEIAKVKALAVNPYGDDDEKIAGAILDELYRRQSGLKPISERIRDAINNRVA